MFFFFLKNVSRPSNPPDELAQNVSKKNPVGRIIPPFFFDSSESDRVFNYLHDSNSIFGPGENKCRDIVSGAQKTGLVRMLGNVDDRQLAVVLRVSFKKNTCIHFFSEINCILNS